MPTDSLSTLQQRLVQWHLRRGLSMVLAGTTIVSVLASCVVSYGLMAIAGHRLTDVATIMLALPVIVPAIVAPVVTHQLASALDVATKLIDEARRSERNLSVEIERRKAVEATLTELASQDPLTGLLNRRGFFERVESIVDESPIVLTIDIDGFKFVNDRHGHAIGDVVLCAVANTLRAQAGPAAVIARLGGDEFVVAAGDGPGLPSPAIPLTAALGAVAAELPGGGSVVVSCSVGSARHQPGHSIDTTLGQADERLYQAKAAHRSSERNRLDRERPAPTSPAQQLARLRLEPRTVPGSAVPRMRPSDRIEDEPIGVNVKRFRG